MNRKMNRLLREADRAGLAAVIAEMFRACPEMMGRKIGAANVQQAWVLERVREEVEQEWGRVLCVGCFEDTACATLDLYLKGRLIGIDPGLPAGETSAGRIACDLHTFMRPPLPLFDCVFATSVLEHVPDDGLFLAEMCEALAPGGLGLLTADYKADYEAGDPLPASNVRFYTPTEVERLGQILNGKGCGWVDAPDLCGEPDFVYQGHHYSFLGLAFRKFFQ